MKDHKDLVKTDIPGFPSLFFPPAIPPSEYRPGLTPIVGNWFKNKKLGQLAASKALEAEIAKSSLEALKAQCEMMSYFMLQGQAMQTERQSLINKNAYEQEMINAQKLANLKASEEIKQLQLDYRKMELEYNQMLKEIGNGTDDD